MCDELTQQPGSASIAGKRMPSVSRHLTSSGRYVREFDARSRRGARRRGFVGGADIQSYEGVRTTHLTSVTKEMIVRIVMATFAPIASLPLTMMPLDELPKGLLGILTSSQLGAQRPLCFGHPFGAQCRVLALPGLFALADATSTDKVKVLCSFGFIAPTPMSLWAISSPRSLRTVTTIVYSQGSPSAGWRMLPSMRSGVSAGACGASATASKRR